MKKNHVEKGQSLAESAIIIPLLLFMLVALLDFGRAVLDYSILDHAAREGTRVAVITPTQTNPPPCDQYITYYTAAKQQITKSVFNLHDFDVNSDVYFKFLCEPVPGSSDDYYKIAVEIYYPYTPIIHGLMSMFGAGDSFTITARSELYLTPYAISQ